MWWNILAMTSAALTGAGASGLYFQQELKAIKQANAERERTDAERARTDAERFDKLERMMCDILEEFKNREATIEELKKEVRERDIYIARLEKVQEDVIAGKDPELSSTVKKLKDKNHGLKEKVKQLEIKLALQAAKEKSFDKLLNVLREGGLGEMEIPRVIDKLTIWYSRFNSDMPQNPLVDPISFDLIEEPRIMPNGVTYSSQTIERIISEANAKRVPPRDPMTNQVIPLDLNDKNYPRNRNLEEVLSIISSSIAEERLADVQGEALANDRAYLPQRMMPNPRVDNLSSSSSASNSASSSFSP